MSKVIPINSRPLDVLDDFSDLYADVKGMSDHDLAVTLGAVRPPKLPYRSVHPVVAQFPQLSNDEYDKLHDDIRRNGQRKAIIMYQGMIWDGRARYDACLDMGLVPRVFALRRTDPVVYLLHRHGARFGRPSTPERRAAVQLLYEADKKEWKQEVQKRRSDWIAEARVEFQRLEHRRLTEPCAVCGLSREYSHTHHSLPLQLQYDLGVDEAIQEYDWLCPVHHNLIHSYISARMIGTRWSERTDYLHRYQNDRAAQARAHGAIEAVFAKAYRLFSDIGGVSPAGNWAMLTP